jgi:hypothetical protein
MSTTAAPLTRQAFDRMLLSERAADEVRAALDDGSLDAPGRARRTLTEGTAPPAGQGGERPRGAKRLQLADLASMAPGIAEGKRREALDYHRLLDQEA